MHQDRWTAVDEYFQEQLAPHDDVLDATQQACAQAGLPDIAVARSAVLRRPTRRGSPRAADLCAEKLTQALSTFPPGSELVCLCIGTDRSTGDSLGPLVGTMLEKMAIPSLRIYGTLDEPVHAVNLRAKLAELRRSLTNPRIIAVDACLGRLRR